MKLFEADLTLVHKFWEEHKAYPKLSLEQENQLKMKIKECGELSSFNLILIFLPFIVLLMILVTVIYLLIKFQLSFWTTTLILGIVQGYISYSWSVYALHECAGHGNAIPKSLKFFFFHSSRFFGPDPDQYAKSHYKHHAFLATKQDGAFTQFVAPKRWLKSLLPFAGILYANDYKIHEKDEWTISKVVTKFCVVLFLTVEFLILKNYLNSGIVLIAILIISPWFGFFLERMRESTEHQFMPIDNRFGARELGFNFTGLLIGGGPWGQPFHLSHHLAPHLPWYAQWKLSSALFEIMNEEQRDFYFVTKKNSFITILKNIFLNYKKLNEGIFYGKSGKGAFFNP